MRSAIVFAMGVLCVLGCTTPQERAAQEQATMNRMIGAYGPACHRLGYAPNSDQWRYCVVHLSERDGAARSGASTSFFGSFGSWGGRGGSSVGAGISVGQ